MRQEALNQRIPLILMDQHMPDADGFMVIEELRKKWVSGRDHHDADLGRERGDIARCDGAGNGRLSFQAVKQSELFKAC